MPRREKRALSFSPEASPPLELRAGHAFYEPNRRYPLFRMGEHFSAAPEMPQEPSHELEQRHGGEHHFPAQNNKTQSANAQPPYDAGNDQASPHDAAAYSQAQHTQDYLRQQFYHYSMEYARAAYQAYGAQFHELQSQNYHNFQQPTYEEPNQYRYEQEFRPDASGSHHVHQANYPIQNQSVNANRQTRQFSSSATTPLHSSHPDAARLFESPPRVLSPERKERAEFANNFGADLAKRKKIRRAGPPPVPSGDYLNATKPIVTPIRPSVFQPPLLILDLNETLLVRETRSREGSRRPITRNYLSTFLQYLCGPAYEVAPPVVVPVAPKKKGGGNKPGKKGKKAAKVAPVAAEPVPEVSQEEGRRWRAVVYSSARRHNVYSMCKAIGLIPSTPTDSSVTPLTAGIGEDEPMLLLWSREMMGLSAAEYNEDVETVKDLESVWRVLQDGRWNLTNSVLLDDDQGKAAMQPYSRLAITKFQLPHNYVPAPPAAAEPSSPRRSRSRSLSLPPTALDGPAPEEYDDGVEDTALLVAIAQLETLRTKSNMAAYLRASRTMNKVPESLVKRGTKICKQLGIPVQREWDPDWWAKCQERRK